MRHTHPIPRCDFFASTGPRSFERGDYKENRKKMSMLQDASTGPRSFERGDVRLCGVLEGPSRWLQRGRALSSAEIKGSKVDFGSIAVLQRGRALSSAEIPNGLILMGQPLPVNSASGHPLLSPVGSNAGLFQTEPSHYLIVTRCERTRGFPWHPAARDFPAMSKSLVRPLPRSAQKTKHGASIVT